MSQASQYPVSSSSGLIKSTLTAGPGFHSYRAAVSGGHCCPMAPLYLPLTGGALRTSAQGGVVAAGTLWVGPKLRDWVCSVRLCAWGRWIEIFWEDKAIP